METCEYFKGVKVGFFVFFIFQPGTWKWRPVGVSRGEAGVFLDFFIFRPGTWKWRPIPAWNLEMETGEYFKGEKFQPRTWKWRPIGVSRGESGGFFVFFLIFWPEL
ncbi:hypothetical protein RhiirA5_387363 [Rhizophagus irregularis]|uniref:Uncharacterized protein n=1 Tax=Rhizophagus irregularis TaxID=588596 RepID=A0A2N0NF15_9GLOM|nr:hypothetical protein RhiirA5_387363 [Rhizophagus irregularis]